MAYSSFHCLYLDHVWTRPYITVHYVTGHLAKRNIGALMHSFTYKERC